MARYARSSNGVSRIRRGANGVSKIRQSYGPDWWATQKKVLERDRYKCTECGKGYKDGVKLHVHHIRPLSRGGSNVMINLRTLCEDCHERQPGHSHMRHR